ncbi:MAG: FIST C-terminal domain-containing protein, partial [Candidatus Omnitrophica bacterium]|nr:FIST C-terminal domain-containing protein [Candidatus Omnitrophota bacterium]
ELETFENAGNLIDHFAVRPEEQPKFICLADPITCDVSYLMQLFDAAYPGAPVTGGLASAAVVQKPNRLWLEEEFFEAGAVGFSLSGDIQVSTLVSQGCRPIGEPLAVTKSEKNIVYEIAGKPALEVLKETYEKLSVEDQDLARTALFVGLAMDEHREKFVRGDFLIRNIVGGDQEQGAIAIGEILQDGQTIQFQLRDRKASDEDLKNLLSRMLRNDHAQNEGAILVSCCGRGKNLFMEADHDAGLIQSIRGPIPMSGFFANGEFGPINRKNYIHGYTSSLTIFS